MKRLMRILAIAALMAAMMLALATPAFAQVGGGGGGGTGGGGGCDPFSPCLPPPDKEACMHGGFAAYTDATGAPFRNQGDCVNFTNEGGAGGPGGGPGGGGIGF
jgi:hypothetical protein